MTTTYNFYIEKNNYDTNEIIVRPDHPIICNDKERLSFKLLDFKYLNTQYNIGTLLYNNFFTIKSRVQAYQQYNLTNVGNTGYTEPDHNISGETFLDTAVKSSTLETMEESFLDVDYNIHYGTQNILQGYSPQGDPIFANNIVKNNFRDGYTTNLIPFDKINNNYIKIHKKYTATFADVFMLQKILVRMEFGGVNTYSTPTTITLRVQASMDNITYTTLTTTNNILTFPATIEMAETLMEVSGGNHPYYKIDIANISPVYDPNIIFLNQMKFYKASTSITNFAEVINYENITIPDGFYNIDNLINKINTLSTKISFSKQDYTNKLIITADTPLQVINVPLPPLTITEQRELIFPNKMTANMLGFNNLIYSLNTPTLYGDKYVNIMNFSKLVISTDLEFNVKTYNFISKDSSPYTNGISNILEWIDGDVMPFTCITYKNVENTTHRLDNRYINEFKLIFCTEKSLPIVLDNVLIHIQITKYKK